MRMKLSLSARVFSLLAQSVTVLQHKLVGFFFFNAVFSLGSPCIHAVQYEINPLIVARCLLNSIEMDCIQRYNMTDDLKREPILLLVYTSCGAKRVLLLNSKYIFSIKSLYEQIQLLH